MKVMLCAWVGTAGLPWYGLSSQLSKYAAGIQGSILTWKKDSWECMTDNKPRLPKDHGNLEYACINKSTVFLCCPVCGDDYHCKCSV